MRSGHTESKQDIINARMRSQTCSVKGILKVTYNSGQYKNIKEGKTVKMYNDTEVKMN